MPILNKKQVLSWCVFDFANSTYSAVIAAVIFPVYYANEIVGGAGDLWWGRAVSLSMAVVALTSPILGGIADFSGRKKGLLFIYTIVSVTAVSMFSFLEKGMALEGFLLIVIANIGMEGGLVFYNSYLIDISEREYQGRVSSWGYGVGYAGSILSLLLALPLVTRGLYAETWLMVAGLFFVFSLPAFFYLPPDIKKDRVMPAAKKGMRFTWNTFKDIWKHREARKFLIAYLIYEDGVNTVIVFSSLFAAKTLGFCTSELIWLYLLVQVTALAAAFLMAKPVDFWGPKKVVSASLVLWTSVVVMAFFAGSKAQFWVIASVAGMGLGTIQAATRAFFAQFVPKGHESEYFGVYSMVGKSSAVIGPYVFGYISSVTGSQRPAILLIALFFLSGLVIVSFIKAGGPNIKVKAPE